MMEKYSSTRYGDNWSKENRRQFSIVYGLSADKQTIDFITGNGGIPFVKDFLRLVADSPETFLEFIEKAKESSKGRQRSK